MSPYLYITKVEGEKILLAAALIAEHEAADQKWIGRYMYQLPISYKIDYISQSNTDITPEVEKSLTVGFTELIKFYKKDSPEDADKEKTISFKSDFLSPRFDFEMTAKLISESQDRIWVRTFNGIYAISKENVTTSIAKAM
ncbi:hypothetical protein DWG20_07285 [Crenobacter cavernae]|uniref:Uncharacterized protein n=2 Tax=Crenobacter cavernae TaxID=2290923 RepID=A0A345Y5P5_9NEIS|nr:hypothetical protein DWG20_07285 [Crenobacter cavernae]